MSGKDNYLLDRQLKDEIRNLLEARGQVAYKDILARIDSFLPEVVRNKPQDYLLNKMIDWPELIKISENNICSLNKDYQISVGSITDSSQRIECINSQIDELLRNHPEGVPHKYFEEQNSEEAVMCLKRRVIEGSIIMLAYNDGEFNNRFYFERQKHYLVPLPGVFSVVNGSKRVTCSQDQHGVPKYEGCIQNELQYGDCIHILDPQNEATHPSFKETIYRVNFEPLDQEKLFSVAFQHPMGRSKKQYEWKYPKGQVDFYLDRNYEGRTSEHVFIFREGVTNDIRSLWFELCKETTGDIEKLCYQNDIPSAIKKNESQKEQQAVNQESNNRYGKRKRHRR